MLRCLRHTYHYYAITRRHFGINISLRHYARLRHTATAATIATPEDIRYYAAFHYAEA